MRQYVLQAAGYGLWVTGTGDRGVNGEAQFLLRFLCYLLFKQFPALLPRQRLKLRQQVSPLLPRRNRRRLAIAKSRRSEIAAGFRGAGRIDQLLQLGSFRFAGLRLLLPANLREANIATGRAAG